MNINEFMEQNKNYTIEKYNSPDRSIIYFICELDGEIIYIGSTMNLYNRTKAHRTRVEFYNKPIVFFLVPIDDCVKLERKLIKDIRPIFNLQWIFKKPGRPKGIRKNPNESKKSIDIREKLIRIMAKENISQTEMAKRLKMTRQRVNQIIYTKACFHAATIKKIEKVLRIKQGSK